MEHRAVTRTGTRQEGGGGEARGIGNAAGDIIVAAEHAAGRVTLNRPAVLNALTTPMRAALAAVLPRWIRDPEIYAMVITSATDRAFCAGGDLRELVDWGRNRRADAVASLAQEYALDWALECFAKPTVSLIDGAVMGSGVGISLYGTHRVAGERYRLAMPETGVGLFPDVGVAWAFARLPDAIGMYLALTGRAIGRADAYRLGLATHCVPAARFGDIAARLADADPVDELLDGFHADPGPGELEALAPAIARCFSAPTVEEILARLQAERGPAAAWAQETAGELARRSPVSLKITHRHVRLARNLDLRATLVQDFRLACRCLDGHDLYEGVRALLIDRDRAPRWQPARLEDVSEAMVEAYFAPLEAELELPTRAAMQAFEP
ncbi:MAG TPA: enoyl-CoA hydratase/isomerase family protein [Hyphomicrobiaceae bacterium]|nr:enoyl-CoA hydratase/isomerase family protein [Hyphomicrobiaceae bacterium]